MSRNSSAVTSATSASSSTKRMRADAVSITDSVCEGARAKPAIEVARGNRSLIEVPLPGVLSIVAVPPLCLAKP